jgi:hypothetical protein
MEQTLNKEEIIRLLCEAEKVCPNCKYGHMDRYKFKLKPPLQIAHVREMELKYSFTLPEDYFKFITEIGNGGGGPTYGLYPLCEDEDSWEDWEDEDSDECEDFFEYPFGSPVALLDKPFSPHKATQEEIKGFAEKYNMKMDDKHFQGMFCYSPDEDDKHEDGFLVICEEGCGNYKIMPVNGEHNGKIFEINFDEGIPGYYFLCYDSFTQFYNSWLLGIRAALANETIEQKKRALINLW